MKKLFTLLTLSFFGFLAVNAQLSVQSSNTYVTGAAVDVQLEGDAIILNNSGYEITTKAVRTNNNLSSGHYSLFCWGGTCFPPSTSASPNKPMPANDTISLITYADPQGSYGVDHVTYVVYDVNDSANNRLSLTFTYDFAVGMYTLHSTDSYLNLSQSGTEQVTNVAYKINDFKKGKLVIRNLLGSVVKTIPLNEKSGVITVPTADITPGIYMFLLYNDDQPIATKKTVVSNK